MHVLLTGATGATGRHLLTALLAHGHRVTAVRHSAQAALPGPDLGPDRLRWVRQDLSHGTAALPDDYDAVIHTAAHAPPRPDSAAAHAAHNVIATRNLIEHATRTPGRRFVFLSSLSVYGRITVGEVDETTPVQSPGSYGLSKLLGEQLLAEAAHHLAAISLRLPGIVGTGAPGPWLERTFTDLRAGRAVRLHSAEHPFNNLIHIDDLAAFSLQLLDRLKPGHDILTLAAAEPMPLAQIVAAYADAVQVPCEPAIVPAKAPAFTISGTRAAARYGFTPLGVLAAVHRLAAAAEPQLVASSTSSLTL